MKNLNQISDLILNNSKKQIKPVEAPEKYKDFYSIPDLTSAKIENIYISKSFNFAPKIIHFNGAIDRRKKQKFPVYQRWSWFKTLNVNMFHVNDPMITSSNDIALGWYTGNQENNVMSTILKTLNSILLSESGEYPMDVATGSSGGGFAAIRAVQTGIAKHAIVFNPQTAIEKYHAFHVDKYKKYVWSKPFDSKTYRRMTDISYNLGCENKDSNIWIFQNFLDKFHFENHFLPLLGACSSAFSEAKNPYKFLLLYDKEKGHNPVNEQDYTNYLIELLKVIEYYNKFQDNFDDPELYSPVECKTKSIASDIIAQDQIHKDEGGKNLNNLITSLAISKSMRTIIPKASSSETLNYYCPVCEKFADSFLPYGKPVRKAAKCPNCGALERHRLVWFFFKQQTNLFDGKQKRLLHVAPERGFYSRLIENIPGVEYLSADLNRSSAMLKMDLTNIQFSNEVFDVILCSHVLEHIPDDIKAMSEMCRILKPGGWAVIQVPIAREFTYEDWSLTTEKERIKFFGQRDHVRIYGIDIIDRLRKAGFTVKHCKPAREIAKKDAKKMALKDQDIFYCTKT